MRIGIDAHHLNGKPQGSRTYLIELIRALVPLVELENELKIYSFQPAATERLLDVRGPRHHRVFPKTARVRLPFVVPALELVHGLDLFHSQYIAPPVSFVPEVVTIHDVLFETHPELFEGAFSERSVRLIRRSAARASAVLTVSEYSKQAILEAYELPEERVWVTPNAVDHDRFRPFEPPSDLRARYGLESPFVLSVGRLEPRKNLERLVRAFATLPHDVTLAIVGMSDFRFDAILDAAKDLPDGTVKLLGAVPDAHLPALYNLAEALAYPSLAEGFGLPVLESMACGTPLLTSHRGALSEVAGNAALYIDPEDVDSIADGLSLILTDSLLREKLTAAGLARAKSFTWTETAQKTLAAYQSVL